MCLYILLRRLPTFLREYELDQVLGCYLSPFGHPVSGAHASTEIRGHVLREDAEPVQDEHEKVRATVHRSDAMRGKSRNAQQHADDEEDQVSGSFR